MTFSKRVANATAIIMLAWLCYALAAPMIAGPFPMPRALHNCPSPVTIHGVGSDLKTFVRRFDRCAQR